MGKAVRRRQRRNQAPPFTRSETKRMELCLEKKDELLDNNFCEKLTEDFNLAMGRAGSRAIQMEQVQRWFKSKQNETTEVTSSPTASKEVFVVFDSSLSNDAPESSSDMPKDKGEKDLETLEFEARSTRDGAWYDVASFLAHRVVGSGELEVRVRFEGFGAEDDEWVNIRKAIRERSKPLESYECHLVAVGDPVLCFRDIGEQAMHFDAHVVEIQRKVHDIRGCRCLFLVRYDHDQIEEQVRLTGMCRRKANCLPITE